MPRLRKPKASRIRLQSKARIRRRLFKKWSEKVRERDNHICIVCGMSKISPDYSKLDAHHYLQRNIKDSPLKFDIRDGGTLCPSCHKFDSERSAHKSPIIFYAWLQNNRPDHYEFVRKNAGVRVDLDNRDILAEIERCLDNNEPLDLNKLVSMDNKAKGKTNADNNTGQPVPHVSGQQARDAVIPLSGSVVTPDQTDLFGVE